MVAGKYDSWVFDIGLLQRLRPVRRGACVAVSDRRWLVVLGHVTGGVVHDSLACAVRTKSF